MKLAHWHPPAILLGLAVSPSASGQFLVNDTFSDTDRIGGQDGSSTNRTSPEINAATSTNTQWVANGSSTLVASGSGMLWDTSVSSNRMAIGYFPDVTIGAAETTFTLNFTTGNFGATVSNLRIALVNAIPNGIRTADGFSSSEESYTGDVGYAVFSASSTVGRSRTTDLGLKTYQRNVLGNNLLGTSSNWGDKAATTGSLAQSSGATGYLDANTDYNLSLALSLNAGELSLTTSLTGGNFSGLSDTATDDADPVTLFNALALRLGNGDLFFTVNLTSFTITTVPEPSALAALAGLGLVGFVATRRRRQGASAA